MSTNFAPPLRPVPICKSSCREEKFSSLAGNKSNFKRAGHTRTQSFLTYLLLTSIHFSQNSLPYDTDTVFLPVLGEDCPDNLIMGHAPQQMRK